MEVFELQLQKLHAEWQKTQPTLTKSSVFGLHSDPIRWQEQIEQRIEVIKKKKTAFLFLFFIIIIKQLLNLSKYFPLFFLLESLYHLKCKRKQLKDRKCL